MKNHLNLFHPTFKTLSLVFFIYGIIISLLIASSINLGNKNLGIAAIILGGVMILYFTYSSIAMVRDFLDKRKELGIIKMIKRSGRMFSFIGTIISSIINYVFSYIYLIVSVDKMHFFYFFISIFYLFALIIKFFILSSIYEDRKIAIIRNYILTSIGVIILGIFMAIIVFYVIRSEGNFTKSVALLIFNIFFATFKTISAIFSFKRQHRKKSYLKLSLTLISVSFSIFSIFTIHVAFLNYFDKSLFSLNFTGYPFAFMLLAFGIFSLVIGIKDYLKMNKAEENDETL